MNEDDYLLATCKITEKIIYGFTEDKKYYSAFSALIICHTDLFRKITDRNPELIRDLTSRLRGE